MSYIIPDSLIYFFAFKLLVFWQGQGDFLRQGFVANTCFVDQANLELI